MEFSDRESFPNPSHSDGNSVEFVAETPGTDWKDNLLMFCLRSNVSSKNSKYSSLSTVFSIPERVGSLIPASQQS